MEHFLIDINPDIELPTYDLVLCKLNEEPIQELYNIEDLEIKAYFANIDEISFRIPFYTTDNNGSKVKNELFDLVDGSMMVLVNNMKYFILTKPETVTNEQTGEIYKTVLGFSREYELGQKILIGYDGISRTIYDYGNQQDESGLDIGFLNHIERYTSWKVGYVNAELLSKHRYLSFSKTTFLQAMVEVQKTFDCLFQFDTINKTINVYDVTQLGKNQGLYISDRNFINKLSLNINHDEIKTRLILYGKDNLSIQKINITGQPYIENFDFYKNTKYMTQGLIDALDKYDNYVKTKEDEFKGYLAELETLNDTLSTKKIELTALYTDLKIIQSNLDVAMTSQKPIEGLNPSELRIQETNKKNEISTKQTEINNLNNQINTTNDKINSLGNNISLNNHLTEAQINELDSFVHEDEYSDSNYTENNLEEFLSEGKKVLGRISYPHLQFNIEVEDFLSLVEGQHMWDNFVLGDLVTLEHEELGFDFEVRLVGYTHNPDNHQLDLIFSNRDSVDDANVYLKDLLESVTTTASTVDFNKFKWDKGEDVHNKFIDYINSELDLSKQAISTAEGQIPILDDRGIWLYKENTDGSIDPRQIRAINNVIALTQDNWNTVDVAITPNGILASKLIGKVILGADLKIVSDSGIVEILNNLITIKDDKDRLRVALGNYDINKYGLLIKDSTGRKTILDEDGILQTWQEGRTDNVDNYHPLKLSVYIPDNTRYVYKALLRFKREKFRAYSTATESGGDKSITSASGGGYYDSTGSGGGGKETSSDGGGDTKTTQVDRYISSSGGHNHGVSSDVYIQFYDKRTGKPAYKDSFTESGDHEHTVYLDDHTHVIWLDDHSHRIDIPSHIHDINIPSHSHDIKYGIYESSYADDIRIIINGLDKTSSLGGGTGFISDKNNLNITDYLSIGQWNTIEIKSSCLGRIDSTIFIQALMNIE